DLLQEVAGDRSRHAGAGGRLPLDRSIGSLPCCLPCGRRSCQCKEKSMFSGGRWYGFRVGLVLACMSGALHVPQGGHAQPPPGTFNLMVPQFVAEAVRFTAIDESGYDWWGSDEVYAVFSDLNPSVFVGITAVRENVDTGDSHDFSPDERCLAPRPDCSGGVSEFLHFEFSFWER